MIYKCAFCHAPACYKESCPNCGPVPKLADIQQQIDQEEVAKLRDMLTIISNLIGAAQNIIREEIGTICKGQAVTDADERLNALIEAARIYHKQENPHTGQLMAIGQCKECGCNIPSISDDYCRECAWEKLDAALKAYGVVNDG